MTSVWSLGPRQPSLAPAPPGKGASPLLPPLALDHFQRPRNGGRLEEPCATGCAHNPGCGDEVELSVRIVGGAIAEVRFCARGCPASIACASFLTEFVRGRPAGDALQIDRTALMAALGGLPPSSTHAAQLAIDALRSALRARPDVVPGRNTVPS